MRNYLCKFYPSLGISLNLLMGLGVSDFVSFGRILLFYQVITLFHLGLRFLKFQSRHLGESQIYHLPPLILAKRDLGGSQKTQGFWGVLYIFYQLKSAITYIISAIYCLCDSIPFGYAKKSRDSFG